jgi:hypothetical protein
MRFVVVLLALSTAGIAAQNPCNIPSAGRNGQAGPEFTCQVTPIPSSLLLGAIGMAGCGLLLARRRKARA